MRMTPQARPALKADVRELSRTLARAFHDDPVMIWLMPDPDKRTAQLSRLFATMTRHHHLPKKYRIGKRRCCNWR